MSDLKFPVIVSDFSASVMYRISEENGSLTWKKLGRIHTPKSCTGYCFKQRCFIKGTVAYHCLLVQSGKVFFISQDSIFDVTQESWRASTYKTGYFKSVFELFNGEKKVLKCEYFELARTTAEEMDCHFFVDVTSWLKSQETREALEKYWKGEPV